jgi:serine/threonine protein phosphatase PrpC
MRPMTIDSMEHFLTGGLRPQAGVSFSQIKGGRQINEDSSLLESRELIGGSRMSLMGVFDGHGNEQLSHWLSDNFGEVFFKVLPIFQQCYGLPDCFDYIRKLFPNDESFRVRSKRLAALKCPEPVTLSLCASFAVCEEQAMSLMNVDTAHGGACATVVALTYAGFFVAQVGDCSVSLLHGSPNDSAVIFRTPDHRPGCRPDEVSRVIAQGGSVYKGNSVGMAFSSLAVTRSLGDTLWRANDDWKRDKTQENGQLAIDESLSQFSREKGCVGLTSEPEWYSCCLQGGTSGGERMVHWAISTNAPSDMFTFLPKIFKVDVNLVFYLIVGSDGYWETSAPGTVISRLGQSEKLSSHDVIGVISSVIGTCPHDDSTVVLSELLVDKDGLNGPNVLERSDSRTKGLKVPKRTMSDVEKVNHPNTGRLDYLFA